MITTTAFIFTAGFGKRLKPLTDDCPKPLVPIGGKPLLHYIIAQLKTEGITKFIFNSHHLAGQLDDYLRTEPLLQDANYHLIYEPEILETGGAVKNALPLLNELAGTGQRFFVINGDGFWRGRGFLSALDEKFDETKMDILLATLPIVPHSSSGKFFSHSVKQGDFAIDSGGDSGAGDLAGDNHGNGVFPLKRQGLAPDRLTEVFLGVGILTAPLFSAIGDKVFSMNIIYHQAEQRQKLYGTTMGQDYFTCGDRDDYEFLKGIF